MKVTDPESSSAIILSKDQNRRRRNTRYWIALVVGVGLFSGLLWYVSPRELWKLIEKVDITFVLLALAVKLVGTIIRTLQFGLFSPKFGRFLTAYGVISLTRLLTIALPFRAGEIVLLTLLKKTKLFPTIAGAIPIWLVIRIGDVIALAALFSVLIGLSPLGQDYGFVGYMALGGAAFALAMMHMAPRLLPADLKMPGNDWVSGRLSTLIDGLRHVRSTNRKMASVGFGILIWSCLIGMAVSAQAAFNSPFGIWDCALIATFTLGVSMLPINAPMGLGTGETIWATVMVIFGLSLQEAVTLALGIRIVFLAIACFEGIMGFLIIWHLGIWPVSSPQSHGR